MPRSADKLAYALSSCASTARQQYKRLFDRIFLADATPLGFELDDVEHLRRETARNLEALGVCDFVYGEDNSILPCEPHLSLLPRAGLPAAVLVGSRTPSMMARVRALARSRRTTILLTITPQPAFALLPSRVVLQAVSLGSLKDVADALGVRLLEIPAAGPLLAHASSVDAYVASRAWQPHREEPTWRREDFDAARLRFRGTAHPSAALRLSEYTHPRLAHRREHVLVRGIEGARVDRDWGKYVLLAATTRKVLRYDATLAVLFAPVATPLPSIYARAMVACSGFAPQMIEHEETGRGRVFTRVPIEYAAALASKLSQELQPISIPDSLRGAHD
jgi:hypothetical protein